MGNAELAEPILQHRDEILRIAARHKAEHVRLIGSFARGEARPDSDVDLLVKWQAGASLLTRAAMIDELEALLRRRVEIASEGWLKPRVRESVYRDAIDL